MDERAGPAPPPRNDHAKGPFKATPFPTHEAGQGVRYGAEIVGWSVRNTYGLWRRLPRWVRYSLIVWGGVVAISRCGSGPPAPPAASPSLSLATQKRFEEKLAKVARQYGKDPSTNLSNLGALVAKEFGNDARAEGATLLALPFTAPASDPAAAHLVDAAFAQTYTRIALARHGQLATGEGVPGCELKALLERGRKLDSQYVLCGVAAAGASAPVLLAVTLVDVEAGHAAWHGEYPVAGADPAAIAQDVATHVPAVARDDTPG